MKDSFIKVRMDENNPNWNQAIHREHKLYTRNNDIRTDFERDYTRLLHSLAYRRLKHKTQVFFAPKNDHICTRIEHVNHVASVSNTIAKYLGLNTELTSAIAIGHDIGHAPFGHHGEDCLNKLLKQKDGENAPKKFWHERNSLFFADFIETLQDPNGIERNLNLTYAVRDGLICHCGEVEQMQTFPRKEVVDLYSIKRAGQTLPYTWEGCVVRLSDRIAYLGRDLEDARTYHLLDMGAYRELREIVTSTLGYDEKRNGGRAINTTVIINDLIVDLCEQSSVEKGLCFSEKYFNFLTQLNKFNIKRIYTSWKLEAFQNYATNIIETLYNFLMKSHSFAKSGKVIQFFTYYPTLGSSFEQWLIRYSNYAPSNNLDKKQRMHCDTIPVFDCRDWESFQKCVVEYISGMTDDFAIECFEEIVSF